MVIYLIRLVLVSLLGFLSLSVRAQAQIVPAEQERINRAVEQRENEQKRREEQTKERLDDLMRARDVHLQNQLNPDTLINLLPVVDEAPCFVINRIELLGDQTSDFQWLLGFAQMGSDKKGKPVFDGYQGRCLGINGVSLLVKRMEGGLIEKGYSTSKLLLEHQNLKQGILNVRLVVGLVGEIRYESSQGGQASLNNTMVMRRGDVLSLRDIEQSLENLKRVPSVEANFQLKPSVLNKASAGKAYSDIEIAWQQSKQWRWVVNVDDAGGKDTGPYQMGLTTSMDNPFGLSDLFYVSVNRNVPAGWPNLPHQSWSINTHYSVPWRQWLLAVNLSRFAYLQTLISNNGVSDLPIYYTGTTSNADIKISRMVYRDQTKKDTVGVRFWMKSSHNYQEFGDTGFEMEQTLARKRTAGWDASWNRRWFLGPDTLDATLLYRRGTGAFGALSPADDNVDEHPKLWQAEAQYVKPFQGGGWFGGKLLETEQFRYVGQWKIQANKNRLTPAERYGMGSRSWIRGFTDDGWVSGDRGWGIKNDWSWLKNWNGLACDVYVGWDWGKVGGDSVDRGDISAQANRGVIRSGMALGVRLNHTWGKSELNYELFAAKPLIKPDLFEGDRVVYGASVSWSF